MKAPRIGTMRDRVRLSLHQQLAVGASGWADQFPEVATVAGRLEPVGTAVYQASVQTEGKITHRVFIRYRADLTADHVAEIRGRRYRVVRVGDIGGDGRFTVLEVEELGLIE